MSTKKYILVFSANNTQTCKQKYVLAFKVSLHFRLSFMFWVIFIFFHLLGCLHSWSCLHFCGILHFWFCLNVWGHSSSSFGVILIFGIVFNFWVAFILSVIFFFWSHTNYPLLVPFNCPDFVLRPICLGTGICLFWNLSYEGICAATTKIFMKLKHFHFASTVIFYAVIKTLSNFQCILLFLLSNLISECFHTQMIRTKIFITG